MKSVIEGFIRGFKAPVRAAKLILISPSLLSLVAIPLLINLVIYVFFFYYAEDFLSNQIHLLTLAMVSSVPHWVVTMSSWILKFVVWISLLMVSAMTFTIVGGVLASPFNDMLSSRTTLVRKKRGELRGGVLVYSSIPILTSIILEAKRSTILLVFGFMAVILGFIPFFQIPAFLMGATLLSFEYFGYPISRKSKSLNSIVFFMVARPFVSLGFGSALLVLMALPFLGIAYIPLAVVGATILHDDLAPL